MLDIRQPAAPETETAVVCRPTGSLRTALWFVISLQLFLALLIFATGMLSFGAFWPSAGLGVLGSSWLAPLSIWVALYLSRACVIANTQGLRWRYSGRWRKASWADVTSYSEYWPLTTSSKQTKPSLKIRTLKGILIVAPEQWTSAAELRESVQQNATAANQSHWLATGASQYLPLECRYDTTINRSILGWMEKVHKYGLLAVVVYFVVQWFTAHTLPGWGWLVTPTGLFVMAKQTLPFLLRPTYRATQPRLADKVFADEDGLRFVTDGQETEIAWSDITDLYLVGMRSVIVGRDGSEYDFLDTLTNSQQLKLVIPRLAVNAGYQGWRTGTVKRQELVSSDGQQSVECVYRYRSQINCGRMWGLMLAALFLTGIASGPALIAWQGGGVPPSRELALASVSLFGALAIAWLWGNYFRAGIRTNEEGIMQQTVLGRRFLAWSQVRTFRWQGGQDLMWGCIEGRGGTIKFWKGIGDADRLVDEIAAHGVMGP